ncbi:hypothetical protein S83_004534, partial [Arachis hypogaea]
IGISMMRKEVENDEFVKESSSLRKIPVLVGDDLLMSNAKRFKRAVLEYACNVLFLKRDPKYCESCNPMCSKPTPTFKSYLFFNYAVVFGFRDKILLGSMIRLETSLLGLRKERVSSKAMEKMGSEKEYVVGLKQCSVEERGASFFGR